MPRKTLAACFWGLLIALFPLTGLEASPVYQVEVLIFEHGEGGGEDVDVKGPIEGGVLPELLPPSRHRLSGVEKVLARTQGYRPLLHLAWKQPLSQLIRIEGEGIEGTVRLYRTQGLWVELRVLFDDRYYLEAKRKVHPKEIHYFDHRRFGVLLWIEPLSQPGS